ncbi:hypothetical protein ACFQZS_03760 [Mucilaginibacter calamicampi]|uniref:SatD family (SatD) n=1 Tax=Mucilaginibacter calamicampi TaxID=1302352 RepID=A0ABW2YUK1_9SPHI
MKKYAVITGDITDFTSLDNERREELIGDTHDHIKRWVKRSGDAAIFRGDSFQLLFEDLNLAVIRSIQLICWFKKQAEKKFPKLSTRISLGVGELAFKGKTVLDSDGEAFHLSGRNFDQLETGELLRITTGNEELNEQLDVLLTFMNVVMNGWTSHQAEIIYWVLEDQNATQENIGRRLNIFQSNIATRLKVARWKEMEKGINYITVQLQKG